MSYSIEGGIWSSVFAVPCTIVDDHIRMCSPLALKTLLLMLRHPGMPVDTPWLSEQLRSAPADIQDAVGYWIAAGIVTDNITCGPRANTAIPLPTLSTLPITTTTSELPLPIVKENVIDGQRIITTAVRQHISRADVNEMSKTDPNMAQLIHEAQSIMGGPLSTIDDEILVSLYTYYKLPLDVILMLLQYCVSTNRASMHMVEKLAANWTDRNICTHERAEQELMRLNQASEDENKIIHAFHIQGRGLSAKEREFVERWFSLGMDEKVICFACETTIDRTGKTGFPYADKIIMAWKSKNINTIRDAMEELKQNSTKYTSTTPPSNQNKSAQTAGSSIDKDALDAFIDGQFSD